MNTLKRNIGGLMAFLSLIFAPIALADSPVDINKPDSHSVEVKGKVNLYRVQIEGMDFGEDKNKVHAEVLVTIDSKPGMIYTLSLHEPDSKLPSAVNREMAETLRTAYVNKTPVTLYHQIDMRKSNNFRIMMVQLD